MSACATVAPAARAQLEVLLRAVEPVEPRAGTCGVYLFEAEEPDGKRSVRFRACIESVAADSSGDVVLVLWAQDSEVRVTIALAMFRKRGGSLQEHIRSIEERRAGRTRRLELAEWRELPALSAAPVLPVVADSSLGTRTVRLDGRVLLCQGRSLREEQRRVGDMSGVSFTQSESRQLESWTADAAPILGVVEARAEVRSERIFSQELPGVPGRRARLMRYHLRLVECAPHESSSPRTGAP